MSTNLTISLDLINLEKALAMPAIPANTTYFVGDSGLQPTIAITCPMSPPDGLSAEDQQRHVLAFRFEY